MPAPTGVSSALPRAQHGAASRRCGVVHTRRAGAPPAGPPTPTYHLLYSFGWLADDASARVRKKIGGVAERPAIHSKKRGSFQTFSESGHVCKSQLVLKWNSAKCSSDSNWYLITMRLHQDTGRFWAAWLGTGKLTDLKRLGQCFFLNSRKYIKQWHMLRVFNPHPRMVYDFIVFNLILNHMVELGCFTDWMVSSNFAVLRYDFFWRSGRMGNWMW